MLPFIAATPELGEELFGLATIVLNAALMGVDEAVAEAGTGFEPAVAAGGVVTRGASTGGTEATGDGGTLLMELITLPLLLRTLLLLVLMLPVRALEETLRGATTLPLTLPLPGAPVNLLDNC